MRTENALPFHSVPIQGRLHIAYYLFPILSHPDGTAYLYNYFLNMECLKNPEFGNLNYCFLSQLNTRDPSWFYYLMERDWVRDFGSSGDILSDLINRIDDGYYAYIHFDDFYLKEKQGYQTEHKAHVNFIYGYNRREQFFYTVGYNQEGLYGKMNLPFAEAVDGYQSQMGIGGVEFLKTDYQKSFCYCKEALSQQIADYLDSQNHLVSDEDLAENGIVKAEYVYGLSTYSRITEHIVQAGQEAAWYDNRNLYLLWEHKRLMTARLGYLSQTLPNGSMLKQYQQAYSEMTERCVIAKNIMLKWSINKNCDLIEKVAAILNDVMQKESVLLEGLRMCL